MERSIIPSVEPIPEGKPPEITDTQDIQEGRKPREVQLRPPFVRISRRSGTTEPTVDVQP